MHSSHWLLLIPYYFFAALSCLLLLLPAARLVRARISINALATTAVVLGLLLTLLPLLSGWTTMTNYTVTRLFLLACATVLLAVLDTALQSILPLPLDRELEEL